MSSNSNEVFGLRGIIVMGDFRAFNIYDNETGASWWLKEGQAHGLLKAIKYHEAEGFVEASWNDKRIDLALLDNDPESLQVIYDFSEPAELSKFNQALIDIHKTLIKPTKSAVSGRIVRDPDAVKKLREFLQSNPSPNSVSDFLFSDLNESIDTEKVFELEFPKGIPNRNKYNTPGWELKDDVTFEDIQKLISTAPTLEALTTIKKDWAK